MLKKGQAATEYLIILAVVIIIALIVIGVMGGIPGLGSSGKSKVSASYWAGQVIGVDSYAADKAGNFKITLRNNGRSTVTLNRLDISTGYVGAAAGAELATPKTIATGSSITVSQSDGAIIPSANQCTAGSPYSYNLYILYVDTTTGAKVNITGEGGSIKLEGTCANSV